MGPIIGDQLGLPVHIPADAAVANAIGAGVANHTMAITVHVDTKRRTMVVQNWAFKIKVALCVLLTLWKRWHIDYYVKLLKNKAL